jgi:hypothetical protein
MKESYRTRFIGIGFITAKSSICQGFKMPFSCSISAFSWLCPIGQRNLSMDPDKKIKAITTFPEPKSLTQLRSFLGLANFYRGFIPNFLKL